MGPIDQHNSNNVDMKTFSETTLISPMVSPNPSNILSNSPSPLNLHGARSSITPASSLINSPVASQNILSLDLSIINFSRKFSTLLSSVDSMVPDQVSTRYSNLAQEHMSESIFSDIKIENDFESLDKIEPPSEKVITEFNKHCSKQTLHSTNSLSYINSLDMADSIASSLTENFDDPLLDIDNEKLFTLLEDTLLVFIYSIRYGINTHTQIYIYI